MKNKLEEKTAYFKSGGINLKIHMLNGKLHGLQEYWYYNGKKDREYTKVNGQDHGIYQSWKFNGRRDEIFQNKNGNQHGPEINCENKNPKIIYCINGYMFSTIVDVIIRQPNNTEQDWFEYFEIFLKEWEPEYNIPHYTKESLLEIINETLKK